MSDTVSELLIDTLEKRDVDTMKTALLIWRREDGAIGYVPTGDQHIADTMGLLDFVKLSVENELKESWKKD